MLERAVDEHCDNWLEGQLTFMPIIMSMAVPFLTQIGAKFILQTMLEEKQNKMKQTLELMSLSSLSYGLSFLVFQTIFATISAVITGCFLFDNENVFPI